MPYTYELTDSVWDGWAGFFYIPCGVSQFPASFTQSLRVRSPCGLVHCACCNLKLDSLDLGSGRQYMTCLAYVFFVVATCFQAHSQVAEASLCVIMEPSMATPLFSFSAATWM
ncbi:unnamed protein product [Symbiodinium sp. CCMP2456]|nr:unnamed protein product [Symbiodinium sp. CCMP2456]